MNENDKSVVYVMILMGGIIVALYWYYSEKGFRAFQESLDKGYEHFKSSGMDSGSGSSNSHSPEHVGGVAEAIFPTIDHPVEGDSE